MIVTVIVWSVLVLCLLWLAIATIATAAGLKVELNESNKLVCILLTLILFACWILKL